MHVSTTQFSTGSFPPIISAEQNRSTPFPCFIGRSQRNAFYSIRIVPPYRSPIVIHSNRCRHLLRLSLSFFLILSSILIDSMSRVFRATYRSQYLFVRIKLLRFRTTSPVKKSASEKKGTQNLAEELPIDWKDDNGDQFGLLRVMGYGL